MVSEASPSDFCDRRALAALRIVVALLILGSPELSLAEGLAARPWELEFVPEGMGLFADLPLTPEVVRGLRLVVLSSGATALLGFYSRTSMAILTLAALPVYSLSQRGGTVLHDMHLFWMSALLSVSRSGDAWSIDAWGKVPKKDAGQYRIPADFARAFLGVIYFFPGLHKLLESGLGWARAENLSREMHAKWFQLGELPPLRVDSVPWLGSVTGVLVIAFELSFIGLAYFPRTRVLALAAGLAFHAAVRVFMFIPFVSLWACYVVLVPFQRILRKNEGERERPQRRLCRPRAAIWVGSSILLLATIQGFRGQMQAWPFACYPTFQWLAADTLPDLLMEAEIPGGMRVTFNGREQRRRTQAEWGRVFRLSGAWGDRLHGPSLVQHALDTAALARVALTPGTHVRIYRADYETAPERWAAPPRHRQLLGSFSAPENVFQSAR